MAIDNALAATDSEPTGGDVDQPTRPGNQAVIRAIRGHHRQLADRLSVLTQAVLDATADDGGDAERVALYGWYRTELLPHAKAEEAALYSRGAELAATELLIKGMLDEHGSLRDLIDELSGASEPIQTAALAASGKALFDVHLSKENDLLLPALDRAGVDLASALEGMHEILGGHSGANHGSANHGAAGADRGASAGGNNGGDAAPAQRPGAPAATPITDTVELDVRPLPHRQRHDTIFAKLNALAGEGALVIINDHDPLPLRYQTDALWPGKFEWTYRESGPYVWRVAITRVQ